VDDLKKYHVENKVFTDIIQKLNTKYGKESPLTFNLGKKHDYLGMNIDYSEDGHVHIDMTKYIENILNKVPPKMRGKATNPGASYLFETNQHCPKLTEDEAQFYHYLVSKLLFICKRRRPNIQTAIAFLSTRVKDPDGYDSKKLGRVIKYLSNKSELVIRLSDRDPLDMKWWIDGSFAVHDNMRIHTGSKMSMGTGSMWPSSIKQKLNTRSSTEAELVAVDDIMPQVLWTIYLLMDQGFNVGPSRILQDNKSAMLLEENGMASSSKRTYDFILSQIRYT
jgi:hypothetical protein